MKAPRAADTLFAITATLLVATSCERLPESALVSAPIIHIGSNEENPQHVVFAYSFEPVRGAYEHLSGHLYAANLYDGSTALMLRTTTRSGFVPEAVRAKLARWHAEQSVRKLSERLEAQASEAGA